MAVAIPVRSRKQSERFAATLNSPPLTWIRHSLAFRNGITPGSSRCTRAPSDKRFQRAARAQGETHGSHHAARGRADHPRKRERAETRSRQDSATPVRRASAPRAPRSSVVEAKPKPSPRRGRSWAAQPRREARRGLRRRAPAYERVPPRSTEISTHVYDRVWMHAPNLIGTAVVVPHDDRHPVLHGIHRCIRYADDSVRSNIVQIITRSSGSIVPYPIKRNFWDV